MGNQVEKMLGDEDYEVTAKFMIKRVRNQPTGEMAFVDPETNQENGQNPQTDEDDDDDGFEGNKTPKTNGQKKNNKDGNSTGRRRAGRARVQKEKSPDADNSSGSKREREEADEDDEPPRRKSRGAGAGGRPSSVTIRSDTEHPSFDIKVAKTHLSPSFCLNLPPEFCKAHMVADTTYTIVNGNNCKSLSLYFTKNRYLFRRASWKAFVEDNDLKTGDIVHVELLGNDQIRIDIIKSDENLTEGNDNDSEEQQDEQQITDDQVSNELLVQDAEHTVIEQTQNIIEASPLNEAFAELDQAHDLTIEEHQRISIKQSVSVAAV